jgi:hypothetical protein
VFDVKRWDDLAAIPVFSFPKEEWGMNLHRAGNPLLSIV